MLGELGMYLPAMILAGSLAVPELAATTVNYAAPPGATRGVGEDRRPATPKSAF